MLRAARSILLAAFVALALLPLYWMVITAVRPSEVVMAWPPHLLPSAGDLTLEPVRTVLQGSPIGTWLANAIVIALTTTILTVVVATLAGYALSRSRRPWTTAMGYFVLVSKMLPATLLVMPLYIIFHDLGLLSGRLSLVTAILANMSFAVPFATWMLMGYFKSVPVELEEAAMVDGASRLTAFRKVTFPLVAPGLVATAVFAVIQAWNEFIFALVIMNRPEHQTLPVWLQAFNEGARGTDWGGVMAGSTIMAMPVIIFFLIVQRRITTGLTAGAVKG
jgi:ABC-type glycerol-3-phosphate transport system permease component